MAVHGDDFVLCGLEEDLKWAAQHIQQAFEVKVRALIGEDKGDDKEAVVLGRTVRWRSWGLEYEADERHRRALLEQFGFDEDSKALSANGEQYTGEEAMLDDEPSPCPVLRPLCIELVSHA